ncbi:rCG56679 [Rattus norvegicus]|uniref:RCG56679 n=1 Tax=Rattus norvegicus TaxID=10116 RepID=A6KEX4_RAT|nr:rCG56679 [Rattus norvegicus]
MLPSHWQPPEPGLQATDESLFEILPTTFSAGSSYV